MHISNPVHPGEYIKEMYLDDSDITDAELAKHLDVSPSTLSRILSEKADLSIDMAIRLSKVLGRSPESWMNLQTMYSLAKATSGSASEKFAHLTAIPV